MRDLHSTQDPTQMNPAIVVPLGFFTMVTAIVVLGPFVRAVSRKLDREAVGGGGSLKGGAGLPLEVTARLERMEQAIDSIAIEVERISEGQRFTTKVLAERSGVLPPAPGQQQQQQQPNLVPSRTPEDATHAR
jgi:hypothetical protein